MPTMDIPTPGQSASKQGFGTGLPTPVLLIAIGGGIGLVVFLSRKASSGNSQNAQNGTLLPNTAIMLGSIQESLLNLQGDVTQGNADLSSQLTGVGESLGAQLDTQSAQWQQSFADLNTYLKGNFDTMTGNENALATAIAGLGTQNAGLAQSLGTVLTDLQSLDTGMKNIGTNQTDLLTAVNQTLANQSAQQQELDQIGRNLANASAQDRWIFATNWNQYAGRNQMWNNYVYYDPKTSALSYNAVFNPKTGIVSVGGKNVYDTNTGMDLQYNIQSTGAPGSIYLPITPIPGPSGNLPAPPPGGYPYQPIAA